LLVYWFIEINETFLKVSSKAALRLWLFINFPRWFNYICKY
jgi:hypothetical protein